MQADDHVSDRSFETPDLDRVVDQGLQYVPFDDEHVDGVAINVGDGTMVFVSWHHIAHSVTVRWTKHEHELVVIDRELCSEVSLIHHHEGWRCRVLYGGLGFAGELRVLIGERVQIFDGLLET